jgi:predicted dehydrogenase
MPPLRLGLLGTGLAARQLYWPALSGMSKQIQLVAVCNRTKPKAQAFARDTNTPLVVDTAEELFSLPRLDAVLISLPIAQQPRYILKALKAGKHVLSEKPVAPNLAAGRALLKAAAPYQRKGLKWLVGENFHFMAQVDQAQAWLEEGALGDVRVVEARQCTFMDEGNPYYHTAWRTDPRFVGGFVVDGGVHIANIVRRLMGLPVELKSLRAQFSPSLPPLDSCLAVLRFRSGAVGTWLSCFSMQGGGPMVALRGSRADLEIHWDHAILKAHVGRSRSYRAPHGSFQGQFRHFARTCQGLEPLAFSPREALADLAFMQGLVQGKLLKP